MRHREPSLVICSTSGTGGALANRTRRTSVDWNLGMNIQWTRVVLTALILEVVLFVVLVPISVVNMKAFLIAVPIGAFVCAFLVTSWLLRPVTRDVPLHGALVGVVATVMYFGLVAVEPGGLAAAVAVYGVWLFWFCQALRIAGCIVGSMFRARR